MNKIKFLLICLVTIVLNSCATNDASIKENSDTAKVERTDGYRCDKVTITGSRFPINRCTTAAQREAELEDAKKVMNDRKNNVGNQL